MTKGRRSEYYGVYKSEGLLDELRIRQPSFRRKTGSGSFVALSLAFMSWQMLASGGAMAQTYYGPGNITSTLNLNVVGRTNIVRGNTTIDTSAASGTYGISLSAGTVTTNSTPAAPITIITNKATGLVANGALATLNAGTSITINNNAGTANANDLSGVRTINSGTATLDGVNVDVSSVGTTSSFTANALFANGSGTTIAATNSTLIARGAYGFGVNANSGTVNLTGGGNTITTYGNFGRGVFATAAGSSPTTPGTVTANQLTITTNADNAIGAYALTNGSINLGTNTVVSTSGANSYGLEANGTAAGTNTSVTMGANGKITTTGNGAWGAASVAGGKVTLAGGPITVGTSGQQSGTIGAYALFATGANSSIDASTAQLTITTSGTNARGAFADTGGKITLGVGTTINTTDADGVAAISTDASSNAATVIVGAGTSITAQGAGAFGARALTGGMIDMTAGNAALTTSGIGAYGMFSSTGSSGVHSLIQANSVTVTTTGSNSDGARADTGSKIEISGTSNINTSSPLSHGAIALSTGSVLVQDNLSITTTGAQSSGAVVDGAGSTLNFLGTNSVVTTGTDASAIVVRNGAQLTFDNVSNMLPSLTVQGSGSALLRAQNPGSVLNIGPSVTVQNGGSYTGVLGALSRTESRINFAPGSSLQLSSPNSAALATMSGGNIVLDDATVEAGGSGNSYGLLAATDLSPSASNTLTMTNGATLTSTQAAALRASGTVLQVSADGSQISGASLISAVTGSTISLTASNSSTLEGDAVADVASTVDIGLATSSHWTGAATNAHDVTLGTPALWTMTGSSTAGQVTNAGEIAFTVPPADPTQLANYKTLTTSNYAGSGGTIRLNTLLDADGSPSDRLVINGGTASGTTTLDIANTVGAGAQTTGDGILVVQANGATTAGAFTLGGSVRAGDYVYTLHHGDANGQGENWYLRSVNSPLSGAPIPTLSPLTLLLLAGALGFAGLAVARRRA